MGVSHLKELPQLRSLKLFYETDGGLSLLKHMDKLETLELPGNSITDAGLVHLKGVTGLQELNLNMTKITDAGLVHLKDLTKLKRLRLHLTDVTGAGVADLQKALPNCKIYSDIVLADRLPKLKEEPADQNSDNAASKQKAARKKSVEGREPLLSLIHI